MSERSLAETQAFFGDRAATWDLRFPDDAPAFARAAAELAPPVGGTVLDLGTGTGRAIEPLRHEVGAGGHVVAVDATLAMLVAAADAGRGRAGALVAADACHLPFADGAFDAFFAAGILHHLPAPDHGLHELSRLARPGARLAVFHPIGRAALAARRGRVLSDGDLLAAPNLARLLEEHGWVLESLDDSADRYLALARLPR